MKYCPKVSIIVPVYNGSIFLSQAIDCALGQDYENIEIIVVNDGSTDDGATEKIALSYGDKIRYYHKENGGVSTALNFALEKMTGDYFSWLSHDDLYHPDKISVQVAYLNKLAEEDPDIDLNKVVLHSATESIDRDGKVINTPNYSGVPEKENNLDAIIANVFTYHLAGCSFLLPAACIGDIGCFREDIRTVSDVEFWYRLLFEGYQFYCIHKILIQCRSHGKQVGSTMASRFDIELDELHRSFADRLYEFSGKDIKAMERFYLGLKKRRLNGAAAYTRDTYLHGKLNGFYCCTVLPAKAAGYTLIGKARLIARDIYRKINVK